MSAGHDLITFAVPGGAPAASPRRARARGFALLDTLIAGSILAVAVMGHTASTLSSSQLSRAETERGQAMVTLQRFIERLRADDDWATLYARLKAKTAESSGDSGLSHLDRDTALTTYVPAAYYVDFSAPSTLGTVKVLVQVPSTVVSGVSGLRESTTAPRYGLPFDLDGDGVVDALDKSATHRALPIVVRLRWARAGQAADEVVLATWLRKDG